MITAKELPENTVVIYIDGGVVQWTARGAGRLIDVLIIDHDDDSIPEFAAHWEHPRADVEFDEEIAQVIEDAYKPETETK